MKTTQEVVSVLRNQCGDVIRTHVSNPERLAAGLAGLDYQLVLVEQLLNQVAGQVPADEMEAFAESFASSYVDSFTESFVAALKYFNGVQSQESN